MRKRDRRNKRTSMRGWWKVTPFIVLPICLLLVFFKLETHRLHNEYRTVQLIGEIRAIETEIALLRDMNRDRNRMERMEEASPILKLREPNPNQIKVLSDDSITSAIQQIREFERAIVEEVPITRSARIIFEDQHSVASNPPGSYR